MSQAWVKARIDARGQGCAPGQGVRAKWLSWMRRSPQARQSLRGIACLSKATTQCLAQRRSGPHPGRTTGGGATTSKEARRAHWSRACAANRTCPRYAESSGWGCPSLRTSGTGHRFLATAALAAGRTRWSHLTQRQPVVTRSSSCLSRRSSTRGLGTLPGHALAANVIQRAVPVTLP